MEPPRVAEESNAEGVDIAIGGKSIIKSLSVK